MKKFICPICGNEFESGSPQARYCTVTCQRRAKAHRRSVRESHLKPPELIHDDRFFVKVNNTTTVQLDRYAQLILQDATDGKPIQFFGTMPYWISPSGIILAEQFGVEPRQWVMQRAEPANDLSAIDELLGKV